jgi:hypothetical protein
VELATSLERHSRGEVRIVPVLLSMVDWTHTPFSYLQPVPENARPVTACKDKKAALKKVATVIQEVALQVRKNLF